MVHRSGWRIGGSNLEAEVTVDDLREERFRGVLHVHAEL